MTLATCDEHKWLNFYIYDSFKVYTLLFIHLEFTMARVTLKSQAIIIDQLTAQVAELTTQVGILMNQLQAAQQVQDVPQHLQESYATLVDERNELIAENQRLTESCVAAHERCDALEAIIAAKSASQPQRQVTAPKPLPSPAVVDAAPTIEVSDFDRAMWCKFQALPRETRLEIIAFARPEWGHVGIHNIVEIRAAWHNAKPISA
jgi:hypothetical protein